VINTEHSQWGAFTWRPDGERFATAGGDGLVRLWDPTTGARLVEHNVAVTHIAGLDYTHDGRRLVVGERTGDIYAIDAETLQPVSKVVHTGRQLVFAFASPEGRRAAGVTRDGRVVIVDLLEGRVLHVSDTGMEPFIGAFSPDGQRFAVTGWRTGQTRLLDVASGRWLGPPRVGHDGSAWYLAFAPDGTTFVSGGSDGAVSQWDGHTGALLATVHPGTTDWDVSPIFLRDGHTVVIASMDGSVSTWDTRPQQWVDFACKVVGRNLTREEWRQAFGSRAYHATCPTT
jgi:WD40 repeat protein